MHSADFEEALLSSQLLQSSLSATSAITHGIVAYSNATNSSPFAQLATPTAPNNNGNISNVACNNNTLPQNHPITTQEYWAALSACNSSTTNNYMNNNQNHSLVSPNNGRALSTKAEFAELAALDSEPQRKFPAAPQGRQPFGCLTNSNNFPTIAERQRVELGKKQQLQQKVNKDFRNEPERVKYLERRSKNNEAAKNSRTKRREREQFMSRRMEELEKENQRLREELAEERRKNQTKN